MLLFSSSSTTAQHLGLVTLLALLSLFSRFCLLFCLQDAMKAAAEQDASAAAAARNRADQLLAEAEVAAAERLLQAAEIEYNSAMQEQQRLSRAVGQVSALLSFTAVKC
jgi:hypothetical protein